MHTDIVRNIMSGIKGFLTLLTNIDQAVRLVLLCWTVPVCVRTCLLQFKGAWKHYALRKTVSKYA